MARREYANLKELRERLIGLPLGFVSRSTGLPEDRLAALEELGEAPTIFEMEVLGRLYGLEAELLADEPISLRPGDSISTLALQDEFRDVSASTKARIVAAANAARDLVELRKLAGEPDARQQFIGQVRALKRAPAGQPPFGEGRHYARLIRQRARLGLSAIASVRDFVTTCFPSVAVLHADLGREGVAGLTFADALRGPVLVLNLEGRNTNPCMRRFSLAHELCHLLVDWNRQEPLATLSGFLEEARLEVEQRANAFAVRLLCSEQVLQRLVRDLSPEDAASALIEDYGLHYGAARLYLKKAAGVELPDERPAARLMSLTTSARWVEAERPAGLEGFPLPEVPPERRTLVAQYAARLFAEGKLPRDRFADLLRVPPSQEVERVLDFFELEAR